MTQVPPASVARRLAVIIAHTSHSPGLVERSSPQPCSAAKRPAKRVLVIGTGISGTAAMKSVLEEGMELVCFEKQDDIGGFWKYTEDPRFPCVYNCTHIDSMRDHNSYSTVPCTKEMPQVMDHKDVMEYLRRNHEEYKLNQYIRFKHEVTWITDALQDQENGLKRWRIDFIDSVGDAHSEVFEGVMICSGRHSRARLPVFEGMDRFKGFQVHTNRYKDKDAHGLAGKRVVVVGVGNSGNDMVTEIAPVAEKFWWVARRGTWIYNVKGVPSRLFGEDRYSFRWSLTVPWQLATRTIESSMKTQPKLNDVGLQPDHHFLSGHPSITGYARGTPHERGANGAPLKSNCTTIHELCDAGRIIGKRGIARITESTVVFTDGEEVECDAIIYATGFKQAVEYLDPEIVDMTYDREDAEVADKLYQYVFPMKPGCGSIGFITFCQCFTMMAADLQTRLFARIVRGDVRLPSVLAQQAEMQAMRSELEGQFTSSPRHAIQGATRMQYYDALAKLIGCYPSFWKVVMERPSAFRHAFFTPWTTMQYRLVGHGATEEATRVIDDQASSTFQSRGGTKTLTGSGWPNSQYFKQLFQTWTYLAGLKLRGFDGSKLPRPKYLAEEYAYSGNDTVTKEQNSNVAGSRSEQVAKEGTVLARASL